MTETAPCNMIGADELAAMLLQPCLPMQKLKCLERPSGSVPSVALFWMVLWTVQHFCLPDRRVILDCRSFLDFNSNHVVDSVNIGCSKLLKRRLQNDKMSVSEFLAQNFRVEIDAEFEVVAYDQSSLDLCDLMTDSCLAILLKKLDKISKNVSLLSGGFVEFELQHPDLCVNQRKPTVAMGDRAFYHPQQHSVSQPCLPVANLGPTKILPFLFLGSQVDALSFETMAQNGVAYVLNVSPVGQKPEFIQDGHFLRIPVNDNYSDKLLPFFRDAFQFLDKVREANGCVLVHCLAGISRSPTVVIAYIMHSLRMTMDEAYRYVKDKRPSISPNFNFLGQLLEYEKQQVGKPDEMEEHVAKKKCVDNVSGSTAHVTNCHLSSPSFALPCWPFASSPTQALARLSFGQLSPLKENPLPPVEVKVLEKCDVPRLFSGFVGNVERPVVVRLGSKHVKRPFSSHEMHSQRQMATCGTTAAKRPLVRPSSIAFLPLREVTSPTNETVDGLIKVTGSETAFKENDFSLTSDMTHPCPPFCGVSTGEAARKSSSLSPLGEFPLADTLQPGKTRFSAPTDVFEEMLYNSEDELPSWRKRKSRSLEDILSITYDITDRKAGQTNVCVKGSCYMLSVLASPISVVLNNPLLDCRTSNSNVTLSSARSDQQRDSREMIPVS